MSRLWPNINCREQRLRSHLVAKAREHIRQGRWAASKCRLNRLKLHLLPDFLYMRSTVSIASSTVRGTASSPRSQRATVLGFTSRISASCACVSPSAIRFSFNSSPSMFPHYTTSMKMRGAHKIINYTLSIDKVLYLKYNPVHQLDITQERKPEMVDIDQSRMQQVAQAAFDKVPYSPRWQTAIVKAKQQLEENPYIHFDGCVLLILSPSGEIYSANSACQCKAYRSGQPCWHRAAARLVERYLQTSH